MACISPQNTVDEHFFFEDSTSIPKSNSLKIIPAEYKNYIPVNMIRRSSHVLKMGISAGLMCLKKNNDQLPDAIIVGTAMGCFEDTDKFLRSIDENQERTLTPTSFIQSTHNTVAGQIALLIKCHAYNFTYVHQNLSFEYAVLDALLLLKENEAKQVLVGGVDELIPPLVELFDRAGHLKKTEDLNTELWKSHTKGYVAGEGSAFFSLSASKSESTVAKLSGLKTIHSLTDKKQLQTEIDKLLTECGIKKEELSLVLSGVNGDVKTDAVLNEVGSEMNLPLVYFKQYCGEYFTSSAFALWFACAIVQKQRVPASATNSQAIPKEIKHILIMNQYQNKHYSLICVSSC